jgi:hypothetical protein
MIHKLLYVVLLSMFVVGCSGNTGSISRADNPPATRLQTNISPGEIQIIRSNTTLNRGDIGFITIQGRPGVKYTIQSTFKIRNQTIPVTQWRRADANGQATFNWVVGLESAPGSYPTTISGDGNTIRITHTVLP